MKLTDKNFCPYVKDASTALRIMYLCKKTNKICPKVEYDSGKALPSRSFIKNGCPLNEKEEVVETPVIEVTEEVIEEPIVEIVEEVIEETTEELTEVIEEIVEEKIEEPVVEEIKIEEAQEVKPKTNTNNNRKRKSNKKK